MSASFVDRLDRFVRWFFNSSPTVVAIEPTPGRSDFRTTERKRAGQAKPRARHGNPTTLSSSKAARS